MRKRPQVEQAGRHPGGGHESVLHRRGHSTRQGDVGGAGTQRVSR